MRCAPWLIACVALTLAACTYKAEYASLRLGGATLSATSAPVLANGHDTATITLSLQAAKAILGTNIPVRFAVANGGQFTLSNPDTVIDANGIAQTNVTSTSAGDADIMAYVFTPEHVQEQVDGVAQAHFVSQAVVNERSNISASPNVIDILSNVPCQIQVQLSDSQGYPVTQHAVTFTSSSGVATVTPASSTTDSQGTVVVNATATQNTNATFTANFDDQQLVTPPVHFFMGAPSRVSFTLSPNAGIPADGVSAMTATLVVQDSYGYALPNYPFSMVAIGTRATPYSRTLKTDGEGASTTAITSTYAGPKTITAFVNGVLYAATGTFSAPAPYCTSSAFYAGRPPSLAGYSNPTQVQAVDVDKDGTLDLIATDTTYFLSYAKGKGSGRFAMPLTPHVSPNVPLAFAVCDFNNDTFPDVVSVDNVGNVLLFNGSSGGLTYQNTYAQSFTAGVVAIACADMNKDGKADLILSSQNNNEVITVPGTGSGFSGLSIQSINAPLSITVADYTADGNVDVVVPNHVASVFGLPGKGNGSLGTAVVLASGSAPTYVAASDLNGDSKVDLIVADANANSMNVLLNQGSGVFTSNANVAVTSGVSYVAVGDVTSDGTADLVACQPSATGVVNVFAGSSKGGFGQQTSYISGWSPLNISLGDVDGVNGNDIVTANYAPGTLSILPQSGTGTFGGPSTFSTLLARPTVMASGDVNNDGNVDLVVANEAVPYGVELFVGDGHGGFAQAANVQTAGTTKGIKLVDLDGDGYLDLVGSTNSPYGYIYVASNGGQGTFTPPTNYALSANNLFGVAVADFDGNGLLDIATCNAGASGGVFVLSFNGTPVPGISAYLFPVSASSPSELTVGDLNNDGWMDIVVSLYDAKGTIGVLLNKGGAGFSSSTALCPNNTTYAGLGGLAVVDLDLDGHQDVVAGDNNGLICMMQGTGSGSLVPKATVRTPGKFFYDLWAGDFNGDAIPDIIVPSHNQYTFMVMRGTTTGGFNTPDMYDTSGQPYGIAVDDYNNDGHQDIALVDNLNYNINVHLYTGCP